MDMHNYSQENDNTLVVFLISVVITAILMLLMFYVPSRYDLDDSNEVALPDFEQYSQVNERKQAFFEFLRPLVEQVNQSIEVDRAKLMRIQQLLKRDGKLSEEHQEQLIELGNEYRIDGVNDIETEELIDRLLLRVDTLPSSLVLAQAANESAWGRSRFAREGNNLFGQWCFKPGCGIVPKSRPDGESYEVAVFDSPIDSVRSYVMNLNTFVAYQQLRKRRAQLLRNKGYVPGIELAEELIHYSTRREEYVKEIKAMIRQNDLEEPVEKL